MRLDVTFRNTPTSDALRERAEKKFAKVAKHLREPIEAHMVVKVEKRRHMAELTVHAAGRQYFDVSDVSEDMYATVDGVMQKLERVVRRAKERRNDIAHSGPGDAGRMDVDELDDDDLEVED